LHHFPCRDGWQITFGEQRARTAIARSRDETSASCQNLKNTLSPNGIVFHPALWSSGAIGDGFCL
jgi:hypothetical protein